VQGAPAPEEDIEALAKELRRELGTDEEKTVRRKFFNFFQKMDQTPS